jgi:hypothetical protein
LVLLSVGRPGELLAAPSTGGVLGEEKKCGWASLVGGGAVGWDDVSLEGEGEDWRGGARGCMRAWA